DTVNDIEYDVPLEMDGHTADLESAINDQKTYQQQLQEKERKEQIEKLRKMNEAYDKLIDEGDRAMGIEDFKQALKKYSDASQLKPYDKLAFAKIANLQIKREQSKLSREQVYNDFIYTARNAVKRREYEKAINAFEAARGIDPIKIGEYNQEINDLKVKYNNVAK